MADQEIDNLLREFASWERGSSRPIAGSVDEAELLLPTSQAKRVDATLDEIDPQFADAVMDPANWGLARGYLDLDEALLGMDFDLLAALDLPESFPPMRLPAQAELAASARGSRILLRSVELARWVGERRAVDENGELTAPDAVNAAAALGIPLPPPRKRRQDALPGMPEPLVVKSMRDIPELTHLWYVAEDVGLLDYVDFGHVSFDDMELDWDNDAYILELWAAAFAYLVTESLEVDAELARRQTPDFGQVGGPAVLMLFVARDQGVPRAELAEMSRQIANEGLPPIKAHKAWASWTKAHGDPTVRLLGLLEQHGAVHTDADTAWLRPLGLWAMRAHLVDFGIDVPLLPPVAEMTAADLVSAASGFDSAELAEETSAWLALRSPGAAAADLLAVAAAGTPGERVFATAIAMDIGPAAEGQWAQALDRAELRPYAKMALTSIMGARSSVELPPALAPTPSDAAWLLADVLTQSLEEPDSDGLLELFGQAVPAGDEAALFDAMSRLPHPGVRAVLTMIGDTHPGSRWTRSRTWSSTAT